MDFIEYVAALNLVLRGRLEDKLRWSFKVFDGDDNGRLDRSELRKIVKVKHVYCVFKVFALRYYPMLHDVFRKLSLWFNIMF